MTGDASCYQNKVAKSHGFRPLRARTVSNGRRRGPNGHVPFSLRPLMTFGLCWIRAPLEPGGYFVSGGSLVAIVRYIFHDPSSCLWSIRITFPLYLIGAPPARGRLIP